ncbi:ferrous iron transport protein B [Oceanobacillus halophilus]|uniref:Ferrous iron transport protein B n=1 Tax=Oceanobacillus halophilus TaxID=930130 RepID=A0A494ZVP7_9BACI|nr:ferrous iron transport protein B [Oceanobacillus halophilus]RKQ30273.1 ferrous iron transport protein B [Oceanobacillus halophilus]
MKQIALVGNPNTGKTTLFNQLTGSYEYVGNWSGVTVEKKVGKLKNNQADIIDLPGVHSLNPISMDEKVVTNFLLEDSYSSILHIVDASQLERSMHLTVQLLELGVPMTIALNRVDMAKRRGIALDCGHLSANLGSRVYPIVAKKNKGCDVLEEGLTKDAKQSNKPLFLNYGAVLESGIEKMVQFLQEKNHASPSLRWLAIQYLDGNQAVQEYLDDDVSATFLKQIYRETEGRVYEQYQHRDISDVIASSRRAYIQDILDQSLTKGETGEQNLTEKVDRIVTNKYLGIPLFLFLLYLIFMVTFNWLGFPLSDLLDALLSGPLTVGIAGILEFLGASNFIHRLILDGILPGVGGVLVFVPQIMILFFFISLLEDSGYMARVTLLMDRTMEKVGLNGKAFIPMIIGFGCNVPGVMAARTIEQPKERLLTILLTPLMSCSARLPIYAIFAGTFFASHQALVVLSLYVLGVVVALILARVFSSTILKNEQSVFLIELPAYSIPYLPSLLRSTWDKGKGFIKKAGTFIFGGAVFIWLLSVTGPGAWNVDMEHSFLAMIGGLIAPLFIPLGFGTWQAGAALITGFLAKESVVSTMYIVYHTSELGNLKGAVAEAFTPLSAYSFLVFILLYIPCLATVATIRKETDSRKWTFFSVLYALLVAYLVAVVIYQGGRLLGFA